MGNLHVFLLMSLVRGSTYMTAPAEVEKVAEARCGDPFISQIAKVAETTELGASSSRLVRFHYELVMAWLRHDGDSNVGVCVMVQQLCRASVQRDAT